MTAGSLMAAELAEQPQVLSRLVSRHAADRDQVRAVLPGRLRPGRLAGTVLLARRGRCDARHDHGPGIRAGLGALTQA